jgi:V/A-type H+-transporting ATPase subunit B
LTTLYREGSRAVRGVSGPLLFVENVPNAGFGELVTIETENGELSGQILDVEEDLCIIQVFEDTIGVKSGRTTVWLEKDIARIPVGKSLLGRILNGRGRPVDGRGEIGYVEDELPVHGLALNPVRRSSPNAFVQTGISSIDIMNTLVRGQKLPVFSGSGLPAGRITAQIVNQATVPSSASKFLVVFAAMGITSREADFFIEAFSSTGAVDHGVFFLNTAGESAVERILTPRLALTAAEYFAYTLGYDVLVVMTDMLYYCESLREIGAAREEVPGRRGFPGYMYSDLASIYERAGCVKGRPGSITQLPIITMPDDDMTHPVVDLSGYITEGQIVLDRSLADRGVYPPINVLPSLSRLMNKGIGRQKTFDEHRALADQLYASYARAKEVERLRLIVGDDGLTREERHFLEFGEVFEKTFLHQGEKARTLEESQQASWNCLSRLPTELLFKLPESVIRQKIRKAAGP